MGVTDFFAGEIATELLKMLINISRKSLLYKSTAQQLISSIEELLPIITEIKYSGVELPASRQSQLDRLSEDLRKGHELAQKVLASNRWNVYKNLQLARKMEKLDKHILRFINVPMQAHMLADVHHLRFNTAERFDILEGSAKRLEQRLGEMKIGGGGWLEEAVRRAEVEEEREGSLVNLGVSLALGKKKVKEMVMGREDLQVFGICGIGGSGKTTLAREFCKDDQVKSYFDNRILFLTVSQSPNVEQLKAQIWKFVTEISFIGSNDMIPQPNPIFGRKNTLVVLDDVWTLSVLEQLIFKPPGCKTLVVSRFKFPTVLNHSYDVKLLGEDEALSLFCYSAFEQNSIPFSADDKLVKQVVNECKGLPLALKVIGASLRDRPQKFWASAKYRLSRGEAICESHETGLLERMALSVHSLPNKVKECFLDLGSFPEDNKTPLDVLINMWVETQDIDEEEAFAILVELSEKNLLTLVKDARATDLYTSYYEIAVTQHDVLRDLALHLSNQGDLNERRRLLMPKREMELPKEWKRNMHQPFNAEIVSIHTGEMTEMDWSHMEFPRAEVLILNFSSGEYFLPPFINHMPNLRALILINHGSSMATLHNLPVLSNLPSLRSLWLEKVAIPQLFQTTVPLKKLQKLSIVLCKVDNSHDQSHLDLSSTFPSLLELTMDHCDDLVELPSSICGLHSLKRLSITNCHSLHQLPAETGKLYSLEILRIYACPGLKSLPTSICELVRLEYVDISQCVNLECLPENIGALLRLEKINMRECLQLRYLPESVSALKSLRRVICDEEVSWLWNDVTMAVPDLRVQVPRECFNLDWLED